MNIAVEQFTKGKNKNRNEDFFDFTENSFVLSDGATDKSGQRFAEKTGGEIISRLLVEKSLENNLNGIDLIRHLTGQVENLYKDINTGAIKDPSKRFSATLICVRVSNDKIVITQVGDSSFRINGEDIYKNDKLIDILNSEARSNYIEKTGDMEGGRN